MNLQSIEDAIKELDKSGMRQIILDFYQQVRKSNSRIPELPKISNTRDIDKILILGMGGSAISGDLVRNYIDANHAEIEVPIFVTRNYIPPRWIDSKTLIIAISYSGNTEETLSGLQTASLITKHIIGITSGGSLEEVCKQNNYPIIKVPGGFQPRAALGYMFFNLLNFILLNFCVICTVSKTAIEEEIIADFLENKGKQYNEVNENNEAIKLAMQLYNKQVVIYSSSNLLDVVNLRWRGQIQENAKNLAFGNFFPEMNHNEINSWLHPNEIVSKSVILFLKDKKDDPRIQSRILATKHILATKVSYCEILESNEDIPLLRLFDLIYFADWVSYYLSILNNQDPTPIPLISQLKQIMQDNK